MLIKEEINKNVKKITEQTGQISGKKIEGIVNNIIGIHYKDWKKADILPHLNEEYTNGILNKFSDYIQKCISEFTNTKKTFRSVKIYLQ